MENKKFAYLRVSTKDQNLERQIEALRQYCDKNNISINERDIYLEEQSGKDFNRPKYQSLKHNLRKGDTLIIKELDRLGRNYDEIKKEWHELLNMGVDVIIIDTPILNSNNKSDLEKRFMADMMFGLLAYIAEKERLKTKQRQEEGIAIAKTQKKYKGRKKIEIDVKFKTAYELWKQDKITAKEFMQSLNMKHSTFYNRIKEYESANQ